MDDCIFCKIIEGEIEAKVLYEDDQAMVLLDAFPLVEGHTLVIPKAHHEHLQDLPADVAQSWFQAVHQTVEKLQDAMGAQGMTVGLNNGKVAGQVVPHVHMHLLPRFESDNGGTLHSVINVGEQRSTDDVFKQLKKAF